MTGLLRIGAVVGALVLGACGGGGETTTGGGGGGETESGTSSISMIDNAFEPASVTLSAGSTVEVSNDGQAPHNITIEEAGIDEDVESGQSTSVTVDAEPGEYTMYCEFHREAGMEGTVTIQ